MLTAARALGLCWQRLTRALCEGLLGLIIPDAFLVPKEGAVKYRGRCLAVFTELAILRAMETQLTRKPWL